MNCYICEKTHGIGSTHYHLRAAVGVCHHCGAAVGSGHAAANNTLSASLLIVGEISKRTVMGVLNRAA